MNITKDIVFIDTSVYIAENYFEPQNRIMSLKRLHNMNIISLISTEITNKEILEHFITSVSFSLESLDEKKRRVLKNFPELQRLYESGYQKKFLEDTKTIFDKFMANISPPINYNYCNDVKLIFEKYFHKEKPFGEGKKKDEFPDAFTLQMLEQYCKRNRLGKIIVLSNDPDMQGYESCYLECVNYKEYVTEKQVKAETLQRLRFSIESERGTLCEKVQVQIESKLDDTRLYSDCFNTDEISEIEIKKCEVEIKNEFSIVSEDGGYYIVELEAMSICEVEVTYFDLSDAFYDREDNMYYGGEWKTTALDGKEDFAIRIRVDNKNYQISDIDNFDAGDAVPNFRSQWNSYNDI